MSKITITIETGNAAFHDPTFNSWGPEIGRILCEIADQFDNSTGPNNHFDNPRDINGNTVGTVVIREGGES